MRISFTWSGADTVAPGMICLLYTSAYVRACRANLEEDIPAHSRMVTSDDVFDYMLNLRELNTHIDQEREKLFQEHTQARHTVFQLRNLDDYEELKKRNSARRKTQSAFVREQLGSNVREMSNGESALCLLYTSRCV